jgi:hypothetical protein
MPRRITRPTFGWCKFRSIWWRTLRFQRSHSISAVRFQAVEHFCSLSPLPARQVATVLRGHIVNYASDGTRHEMGPGDMMIMEDLAPAKGHITINMNVDAPSVVQVIQL